jgi:long-chain fatty acid transport protein
VVTFAPGLAYRINDRLSLGMTLNINYGRFDLARHAGSVENVGTQDLGQYSENADGWGYGASIGILAKPFDFLAAGLTVRTASTIRFSGEASISNLQAVNLGAWPVDPISGLKREITWPLWIAAGVAVYPIPGLTITADVHYTQWSYTKTVPYGSGDIDQGTGGQLKVDYSNDFWKLTVPDLSAFHWEDSLQLRFGLEYRIKALAVRGGYYWDPSPAPDRTMNILLPSYDFNGFTAGVGYRFNRLRMDAGLEYLRGRDRSIPLWKTLDHPPVWPDAMPGIHRMSIVAPTIAVSYSF